MAEPWFAGLARSLLCASPRKSVQPAAPPNPAGSGAGASASMDRLRHEAIALDGQIAALRSKIGSVQPPASEEPAAEVELVGPPPATPRPLPPPRHPSPLASPLAAAAASAGDLANSLRRVM